MSDKQEIQKYLLIGGQLGMPREMQVHPFGDYVKYKDYEAIREENKQLREALEKIKKAVGYSTESWLIAKKALSKG